MQETIDTVVNLDEFHPTWDAEAEAPRFIKKQHRFNPQETDNQIPIGLIVESSIGSIHFTYMALVNLPNKIKDYYLRQAKVLKSYLGVSYDSFCMAEKIYRKGVSLDKIDNELVIDEQEKEKIKKYSTN